MALNIKVLIGYHKKSFLINSDILFPIQLGRSLQFADSKDGRLSDSDIEWLNANLAGDDSGENISSKNRYYSELTGIFWAWKNLEKLGNPDYLGFMHYRRQFCFSEEKLNEVLKKRGISPQVQGNLIFINGLDELTEPEIRYLFSDEIIKNSIKDFDILAPCIRTDITQYEKFKTRNDLLVLSDIEKTIDIVRNIFPEYSDFLEQALNTHDNYLFNMFIMRKVLFEECCNFMFTTLFELEKYVSYEGRNKNQKRLFGYVSEVLFTAFFIKKESENLKINKVKIMFEANYKNDDSYKDKFSPEDIPESLLKLSSYIKEHLKPSSNLYIYGAGELCEKLLYCFYRDNLKVKAIFDRVAGKKFGFDICNFSASSVTDNDTVVIASQAYSSEIEKRILDESGATRIIILKINDF